MRISSALLALAVTTVPLRAQDTLAVLRHAPSDTATPGNVITVMFDRPVGGRLDAMVDPAKLLRVEPAIAGEVTWRDPVTLRLVPDSLLPPGAIYTVTVDTGFRAFDGARLARSYRFTFRVPGPRLLARSHGADRPDGRGVLPPQGRVQLLYSAPPDESRLADARIELTKCESAGARTIPMRVHAARRRSDRDASRIQYAYYQYGRDTTITRFFRVVELEPRESPPAGCTGMLVVPTLADDAQHGAEERFPIDIPAVFRIDGIDCPGRTGCGMDGVGIRFSAQVSREMVTRHVRLEPDVHLSTQGFWPSHPQWSFRAQLKPRTRYTVVVDTAIRDEYGRSLQGPSWIEFTTGDYAPSAIAARGILNVPRSGPRTLAVRHVNARTLRVVHARVPESRRIGLLTGALANVEEIAFPAYLGRPDTILVPVHGEYNVPTHSVVTLPPAALDPGAGLTAVRVEVAEVLQDPAPIGDGSAVRLEPVHGAGYRGELPVALVQVTDLAVHAKLGTGTAAVLVTGALDGRPRAGAAVHHLDPAGRTIGTGITDGDGIAMLRIDTVPSMQGIIRVRHGDDRLDAAVAYRPRRIGWEYVQPITMWGLGASFQPAASATATIFAERDIYRPGEMVYLKGIVRYGPAGELRVRSAERVRLVLKRGSRWDAREEHVLRDTVLRTSRFGTVADSLRLPANVTLGDYEAELHLERDGVWEVLASEHLRIAEYRAPEFVVVTRADSAPTRPDSVAVHVAARFLFGAPMGQADAAWSATLTEVVTRPRIPGAEGWQVGTGHYVRDPVQEQLGGAVTLDADGRARLTIPLAAMPPHRGVRGTVEVAVTDVNRQSVASGVAFTIPAKEARLHVLARRQGRAHYWRVGTPAAVDVRAVTPEGTDVPGVTVVATLMHHGWRWNPRRDRGEDTDSILRTDTLRTGASPVTYTFTPHAYGSYELKLTGVGAAGDTARTTIDAWAIGGDPWWVAKSPYHLPLTADRNEYAVGEEAAIAFESPFAASEGWLTVEREGILERRRIAVMRGANVVPVRLRERDVPGVHVSVLLTRAGPANVLPDSASHLLRVGYVTLRVRTDSRRLAVSVQPRRREYGPGDTAQAQVRVTDAAGRPVQGEVTLWAVDEGVLSLTGWQRPDLVARMYRGRGVGMQFVSSIPHTLTARAAPEAAMRESQAQLEAVVVTGVSAQLRGVTAPGRGMTQERLRTDFRPTAFYVAGATTDADGIATLRATLPDNLTTFRLIAVAVDTGSGFGSGDTTMLVTRPMVARPSLPRFVRASDTLHAGAVVNARDGRPRSVSVVAEADGIALQGAARKEIELAAGKGAEARFTFAAPARMAIGDTVTVRLRASDGTIGDAADSRLPVRPDFHPRTHAQFGAARGSAEVVMELPADIDPERSRLMLHVGASPLAPMLAAWHWLRAYRYDCTEQLASVGRAMLAVWRATRDANPNALGEDPRARLQAIAEELARRQNPDGSIAFWPTFRWSTPWLTAHAASYLADARDAGIAVDTMVLARLAAHLDSAVRTAPDTGGLNRVDRRARRLALGDRVAAVEVLRRLGRPNPAAEDVLLRLAPTMTWEDRLRLAAIVSARAERMVEARAMVEQAWAAVRPAGRRVDLPDSAHADREFPSRLAPAAQLFMATTRVIPDHPMLAGLLETLLQQGNGESHWAWSTQDYASLVLALAEWSGYAADPRALRVSRGGRVVFARTVRGTDSTDVPLAGLLERTREGRTRLRLQLQASGDRPTYFAVSVTEVPSKPPVTPDVAGIVVERWYERFSDGAPVTAVSEGELVRVRLRVTVPASRQFVAVEDPLPAGLEAVDLRLRTSGTLKPFLTAEAREAAAAGARDRDGSRWQSWLYGSWDDGWWSPWEHKALHDDRVVYLARMLWPGTYTASYIARAATAGTFTRPPAHAEEMYNPAVRGRSDGGRFGVELPAPRE